MFPRTKTFKKNGHTYEYLVISESIYKAGKGSTTRDIANLGNVTHFTSQDIRDIIDGLIKIFQLEDYCPTQDVEMLEALEHGSIIFWQHIWEKLGLDQTIEHAVSKRDRRITLEVSKYVQMMVINRCIDPLSKLAVTRWYQTTNYKVMKGFSELGLEVNNFYRSMDQLLKVKEEVELKIFEKLKNMFSINVKLTFYDITSTFFYSENCSISENGYSRDNRPDKEQIVIGVLTSYEGYPIKHYVFTGNTKDETTVAEVVSELKKTFNIEETTFVGDRGMITKINLEKIEKEGFNYIMGVKGHQDEICQMIFSDDDLFTGDNYQQYNDLKIQEYRVQIKNFIKWKVNSILGTEGVETIKEGVLLFENWLHPLTNSDTPELKDYKKIVMGMGHKIEKDTLYKISGLIKKYVGKYEHEQRYVVCFNKDVKQAKQKSRDTNIKKLTDEIEKVFAGKNKRKGQADIEKAINKIFEGHKSRYRKYFSIYKEGENKIATGFSINQQEVKRQSLSDGIFILLTDRNDLEIHKIVQTYKNLQEVEILFDDLKNFVDIRPVRHWLEKRVRAHVFICILALLLKRVFEINFLKGKAVTEPLEKIDKVKLIKYRVKFSKKEDRNKTLCKVTMINPEQEKYFNMVGIKNPSGLDKFVWC
jgi:transposase